jgi:hypothetical protein
LLQFRHHAGQRRRPAHHLLELRRYPRRILVVAIFAERRVPAFPVRSNQIRQHLPREPIDLIGGVRPLPVHGFAECLY